MTRVVLLAAVILGLSEIGTARADPLPEPLPVGTRLGHSLCETYVNGPHAGKARSLICDLAGRPAADDAEAGAEAVGRGDRALGDSLGVPSVAHPIKGVCFAPPEMGILAAGVVRVYTEVLNEI